MPALNEEQNLRAAAMRTLAAFDAHALDGELIVVDDGSTDRTGAIADQLASEDPRVRAVHHPRPGGIGAAFWEGVRLGRGELVCMLPGDDENEPAEILRYVPLAEHVDVVIPFVFNKQARSLLRNGLSFAYRFVINTTFLVNFNYTNGTVLYRRGVLEELEFHSTGFFFQTDILVRLVKRGYLFAEVPYRLRSNQAGRASKALSFPSFKQVARGYLHLVKDQLQAGNVPWRAHLAGTATARRRAEVTGVAGR